MTENRKKLYSLENQYINNFHTINDKENLILQINNILLKISPDFQDKTLKSINELLKFIPKINFSSKFLSSIVHIQENELSNKITDKEILIARQYVENLLDINLSAVSVEYVNNSLIGNTEGQCIACSKNNHKIFYQENEYGVVSTDLIIHEFGHAADFTISRNIEDDKLLNSHISIAEAIAYYCQYSFLIEFGTKIQRQGVFGAFIYTYLSIIICKHCLINSIELKQININDIIIDRSVQELIKAYDQKVSNSFINERIKMIQNEHEGIVLLIKNEILPRFGMILALFLLDKDKKFINELIQKNSIHNSLYDLVFEIIPNYEDDISDIESKFNDFFNG